MAAEDPAGEGGDDGETPVPATGEVDLGSWLAELLSVLPGLLVAYLPGNPIGGRRREHLLIELADAAGAPVSVWVHRSWQAFVGPPAGDDALDAFEAYARLASQQGRPVDATAVELAHGPSTTQVLRAVVAFGVVGSTTEQAAGSVLGWMAGRRRARGLDVAADVATLAVGLPLAVPSLAVAAGLRLAAALAPPVPVVAVPDAGRANLVTHLLAEAAPTYLGNAVLRTVALWSPLQVGVGVTVDGTSATLQVGQGRVTVTDGIHPDALVVVDGPLDSLLRVAATSLVRALPRRVGDDASPDDASPDEVS